MRYLLHLAYDGTNYHGWQRQPKVISIQQVLEEKLTRVLKQPITLIGCGRTDAGVHASSYYAHFEFDAPLALEFIKKLNLALPDDIVVYSYRAVTPRWHARFSAKERGYIYQGHFNKNPFNKHFSTHFPHYKDALDWETIQLAAQLLPQYNNYLAYCKAPDRHDSTICTVTAAYFTHPTDSTFEFHIKANRFLRAMVRLLVADLINIGLGKRTVDDLQHSLITGERPPVFKQVPPQGLQLAHIQYPVPERDISDQSDIQQIVNTFYQYARQDAIIGYIFNDVMKVNWEHHLPRIYAFWETVLFSGHSYSGNPVQVHKAIHQQEELSTLHFERWLELWKAVINESFSGEKATIMKERASSMATIMLAKL